MVTLIKARWFLLWQVCGDSHANPPWLIWTLSYLVCGYTDKSPPILIWILLWQVCGDSNASPPPVAYPLYAFQAKYFPLLLPLESGGKRIGLGNEGGRGMASEGGGRGSKGE